MSLRLLTFALAALLLLVQAQLWFGKSGLGRVVELEGLLAAQQADNAEAAAANARVAAEVSDLKDGLEMVEEKARLELGMLEPDEIFVQFAPRRE